jgi:hypothetical protein
VKASDRLIASLAVLWLLPVGGAQAFGLLEAIKHGVIQNMNEAVVQPSSPPAATRALGGGTVVKGANIRSGPGTDNAKVGYLQAGTRIGIAAREGNWYEIEAPVGGRMTRAWIYAPLVEVGGTAPVFAGAAAAVPGNRAATPPAVGPRPAKEITYAGYSKRFQPVRRMLERGDLNGLEAHFAQQNQLVREKTSSERQFIDQVGLVNWLEQGTLAIDRGAFGDAVTSFDHAERLVDTDDNQSLLSLGFDRLLGEGTGLLTGDGESGDYTAVGYERVLMLNYKSLAYMLDGDRAAYNVTRRAIDWQKMEQKAFDEKRREIEKELEEKRRQGGDTSSGDATGLEQQMANDYAKYDKKALSVPSAYVNPFGYYVQAMVQEYESYDDWSLRDNARISYEKALELNPSSSVLKQAVKDMSGPRGSQGSRLVHVVVADGFAPEKKMLTYRIAHQDGDIPVKLTLYEPVSSDVHRIEVQTSGGAKLATLSPVADVEALSLRHQKDLEGIRTLRILSATVAGQAVKGLLSQIPLFGQQLSTERLERATPDMRSWMSLPSTIQATRLRLKPGVSRLKLVSYDRNGRRLASKTVKIDSQSHDFVYARSLDKTMHAYAADGLWMRAGR